MRFSGAYYRLFLMAMSWSRTTTPAAAPRRCHGGGSSHLLDRRIASTAFVGARGGNLSNSWKSSSSYDLIGRDAYCIARQTQQLSVIEAASARTQRCRGSLRRLPARIPERRGRHNQYPHSRSPIIFLRVRRLSQDRRLRMQFYQTSAPDRRHLCRRRPDASFVVIAAVSISGEAQQFSAAGSLMA